MPEFTYQEPFPLGPDTTKYRNLTKDHVSVGMFEGIKKFYLSKRDLLFCTVFTVFCVLLVKCFYLIFETYVQSHLEDLFYIIPVFVFAMVVRIVLFSEIAIIFSAFYAATLAFSFENSLRIFLYTFAGSVLSAYFSGKCENRNSILKGGLYSGFIMCLFIIANDIFTGRSVGNIPLRVFFVLVNGIAGSFIVLGLLPVIESIFDYTTDIKLLELANLEHPLLGDMMLYAPGTYHHSIVAEGPKNKICSNDIDSSKKLPTYLYSISRKN